MSDVGRKTVPDKGRLNRERPVTKALEFPFCTGKSCFFHRNWNGEYEMECTETGRQIRWQGTIKETKGKGGYLEKCHFFGWEPVKVF